MIPTIDVGVFAWVAVIASYLRIAWNYIAEGFSWLIKQGLALYLGSKFWGVFFFAAVFFLVISGVSKILSLCNKALLAFVFTSFADLDINSINFANIIGLSYIVDFISLALTTIELFFFIDTSARLQKIIVWAYQTLTAHWKL